jgi:mRNA interferase MazF
VLILSVNQFNRNPAELCVALPITGTFRGIPIHIPVLVPEGGLTKDSVILCDQLRTLDRHRLLQGLGMITPATLTRVEACVRAVLGL